MSRISKKPLIIPNNVNFNYENDEITFTGKHGYIKHIIDKSIEIKIENNNLFFSTSKKRNNAILGITKVLLQNMIIGVSIGFEKKLKLVGVGYKAKMQKNYLELNLGFSHIVKYIPKKEISINCITATEIIIFGINKQLVGQTAAEIRLLRPPEPYKGKGIRYKNEYIKIKDSKKK